MKQKLDPNFNLEAFQKMLREKRIAIGAPRPMLALKSRGAISAQALSMYENTERYPGSPSRWLPLMKLLGISKDEVLNVDKRRNTAEWITTIELADIEPYPPIEDWRSKNLSIDELKFLLEIAEKLARPLTWGMASDLIEKR